MIPNKTCGNCTNFNQHYGYDDLKVLTKTDNGYFPLGCGHCIEPYFKFVFFDEPACEQYVSREDVRKEDTSDRT